MSPLIRVQVARHLLTQATTPIRQHEEAALLTTLATGAGDALGLGNLTTPEEMAFAASVLGRVADGDQHEQERAHEQERQRHAWQCQHARLLFELRELRRMCAHDMSVDGARLSDLLRPADVSRIARMVKLLAAGLPVPTP